MPCQSQGSPLYRQTSSSIARCSIWSLSAENGIDTHDMTKTTSNEGNRDSKSSAASASTTENSRKKHAEGNKTDASDDSDSDTSDSSDSIVVSKKRKNKHDSERGISARVVYPTHMERRRPRTDENGDKMNAGGSESTDSIIRSRKRSNQWGEGGQSNLMPKPPPAKGNAPDNDDSDSDSSDYIAVSRMTKSDGRRKQESDGRRKQEFDYLGIGGVIEITSDDEENVCSRAIETSQMPGERGFYGKDEKAKHSNRHCSPERTCKGTLQNLGSAAFESGAGKQKAMPSKQLPRLKGQQAAEPTEAKSNHGKQQPTYSSHYEASGKVASSTAEFPESTSLEAMINTRRKELLARVLVESGGALAAIATTPRFPPSAALAADGGACPVLDATPHRFAVNATNVMYPRHDGLSMQFGSSLTNHTVATDFPDQASTGFPYLTGSSIAGASSTGNRPSMMVSGSHFNFSGPPGVSDLSRFGMHSAASLNTGFLGGRPPSFPRQWPAGGYNPTMPPSSEETKSDLLAGAESLTLLRHRPTLDSSSRQPAQSTHRN